MELHEAVVVQFAIEEQGWENLLLKYRRDCWIHSRHFFERRVHFLFGPDGEFLEDLCPLADEDLVRAGELVSEALKFRCVVPLLEDDFQGYLEYLLGVFVVLEVFYNLNIVIHEMSL